MFLCTISTLIRATDTKTTSGHITLRASLISGRSLENLTDIDIGHTATKILGTLQTGIGTTNMKMSHNRFDIPRASTGGNLVETLQGDRTAKVVNRGSDNRTSGSGKAGSIHQIGMIFFNGKLIVNGTGDTDTGRIAEANVEIRSKDRRGSSGRTSTLILNHQLKRAIGLNRTAFTNNRQLHIRATLRGREGRSEIVFQPTARKKVAKNRFLKSSIADTINEIPTILIGSDR